MERELKLKLRALEGIAKDLAGDEQDAVMRCDLQFIASVCETLRKSDGDLWALYTMFHGYLVSEQHTRTTGF